MNALEIKDLSKSFGSFSLQNLTLTVPMGTALGLIGENGAGKSTTISLILGQLRRDSGEIRILGQDTDGDNVSVREDIGVVFDESCFPDGLNARQVDKVERWIYKNWDSGAFYEHIRRFDLPETKPFKEYSRGMKMKLGIAAALSHNSKLLILDEATSGLDPVVRDEVVELFSDFTRDEEHSVLISSHIVSDLEKLCDYIAFLHQGCLMLCEEKDALLAEYCFARGTAAELDAIDRGSMIGRRDGRYGSEAIIRRAAAPAGLSLSPVSIEELFIFMVKEGGRQ